MPSFGEKLKQEREKRKITLEQISLSTKIGTRMLQALEEDKFNQLPGGIFNKGFVRAYSRVVGLDEDQTVAEYLQASGDVPPVMPEVLSREEAARERASQREKSEERHSAGFDSGIFGRQMPWGWFAAILLCVALALSVWSHRRHQSPKPAAPPAAESDSRSSVPTPAASSNVVAPPSAVAANPPSATIGSAPTEPKAPTATSSGANPPLAAGEFTVSIRAREESWVSITSDGKALPSQLLAADSEVAVHARKQIAIKVGNAGGVELRFNGNRVATGGDFGEVKTVTFGPTGLLESTLTP